MSSILIRCSIAATRGCAAARAASTPARPSRRPPDGPSGGRPRVQCGAHRRPDHQTGSLPPVPAASWRRRWLVRCTRRAAAAAPPARGCGGTAASVVAPLPSRGVSKNRTHPGSISCCQQLPSVALADQAPRCTRPAARVLASLRAAPPPCSGVGQRLVCASS